jgi:predicted ester cyclase
VTKTNIQIVERYIDEIFNQKHFDQIFNYCSRDCVIHIAPYVGLGLSSDERGEQVILTDIATHGPAHGNLLPGDRLVRVQDEHRTWETFDELKSGLWGQGVLGTRLTVTVQRAGELYDIPLVRSRVDGWKMKLSKIVDIWRDEIRRHWPGLNSEIKLIFGHDDLVACYLVTSGANLEHQHSAIWSESNIYRLENGKIIEMWGVEDSYAQLKQLGFTITEPVKELA